MQKSILNNICFQNNFKSDKGGRALSPYFGPHRKPKIKTSFTTLSLDCFIR